MSSNERTSTGWSFWRIGNYAPGNNDRRRFRHLNIPASEERVPWSVTSVQTLPEYRLREQFADGLEGQADLSALVRSPNAGVFAALADEALFSKALVEYGAISWPGEIDIAPDSMHAEITKNGEWIVLPE